MRGVIINAHVVELCGAVGFSEAVHEFGGLGFLALGLLAGDFLRHEEILRHERVGQNEGRNNRLGEISLTMKSSA